jgi:nitrogen PTS system EIIA component
MNVADVLTRDSLLLLRKASSLDEAFDIAAVHLSYITSLRPQQIKQVLWEREKKGSTSIGHGVALPHARLDGLKAIHGVFIQLISPIDANAADEVPVDIFVVLLAPENANAQYLRGVGKLATILRDKVRRDELRTNDKETIYFTLTSEDS